jgi:hypothetical protein
MAVVDELQRYMHDDVSSSSSNNDDAHSLLEHTMQQLSLAHPHQHQQQQQQGGSVIIVDASVENAYSLDVPFKVHFSPIPNVVAALEHALRCNVSESVTLPLDTSFYVALFETLSVALLEPIAQAFPSVCEFRSLFSRLVYSLGARGASLSQLCSALATSCVHVKRDQLIDVSLGNYSAHTWQALLCSLTPSVFAVCFFQRLAHDTYRPCGCVFANSVVVGK